MHRTLLLSLALVGIALAGTKSYTVSFMGPVKFGNTEIKAGEYKVDIVDDTKAVIHTGRTATEARVKVETNDSKYPTTTVRLLTTGTTGKVQEIHLGGTKTKLVFND